MTRFDQSERVVQGQVRVQRRLLPSLREEPPFSFERSCLTRVFLLVHEQKFFSCWRCFFLEFQFNIRFVSVPGEFRNWWIPGRELWVVYLAKGQQRTLCVQWNWTCEVAIGRGPVSVFGKVQTVFIILFVWLCVWMWYFNCVLSSVSKAYKSCPFQGGHKYIKRKGGCSDE